MRLLHLDLKDKIREWWNIKVYGTKMYKVEKRLQNVKQQIKTWNKSTFGNVEQKKKQVESDLVEIETHIEEEGRSEQLIIEEKCKLGEYHNLIAQEEIKWK